MKNILVTGGAGFIGSNFVIHMLDQHNEYEIVVYDKLTYAGNLDNLLSVNENPRFNFVKGDICEASLVNRTIVDYGIDTIVNFAAETHVDRSILDPDAFITTNVVGAYVLLEAAKVNKLERFHQVSTDEVYGDIPLGYASLESDLVQPRSPYAASKASGDLMTLAYHTTYGLPATISRGTNNIGPYQYPEKAVPLFATNAIDNLPLPLYGDGRQSRDYQHVSDHCEAVDIVLHQGEIGGIYNIGTGRDMENLRMVEILLDELERSKSLIRHVADRPGHDRRYSLNVDKVRDLGWQSKHTLESSVRETAAWYRENEWWWRKLKGKDFAEYYEIQYGERLRQTEDC